MKQAFFQAKTSVQINRVLYGLYLLLVIYLLFVKDYEWAVTNLGIALVFDPFNPEVRWKDRPLYQKAWLLIHLMLVLTGFCYFIFQ